MRPRLFILILLAALMGASATRAEAAPAAPRATATRIQMAGFMAPVRWADGRVGTLAVTPLLDLADGHAFDTVCGLAPRIADTFITIFAREPIPSLGKGKLDVAAFGRRLTDAINGVLGHPLVEGIDLVPGIHAGKAADDRFAGSAPCAKAKKKDKAD